MPAWVHGLARCCFAGRASVSARALALVVGEHRAPGRIIALCGFVVVGGGADEAPEVYKDLKDVLAAHEGTIRVKHTLTPLGVAMAGAEVFDPYKD